MELIYLYVDAFRNIQKMDFNFSPFYEVKFITNNNQLEINKTDFEGIDNFFGSQITNINGVVGMNSSGKSNLLDLICMLTKGGKSRIATPYILLFQEKVNHIPRLSIKTNINDLILPRDIHDSLSPSKSVPDLSVIYFSNVVDGRESSFSKEVIDLSQNGNLRIGDHESEVSKQIKFLLSDYREEVELDAPRELLISTRFSRMYNSSRVMSVNERVPAFKYLYERYRRLRPHQDAIEYFRFSYRFGVFNYLLNLILKNGRSYLDSRDLEETNPLIDGLNKLINTHIDSAGTESMYILHGKMAELIDAICYNLDNQININKKDIGTMLEFDKEIEELEPRIYEEKILNKVFIAFNFNRKTQNILKRHSAIFDYPDIIDVQWTGISSGHKAFLNIFSQFHSVIRRVSQHSNVLICIDEGDLYLHPEWQREFLNRLVSFVPLILRKKLQFILTTHSPFLVSDLPREHLILLKPEDGLCKISKPSESIERTFGANIVDLFLGSFFLKKGTISEFSLNKIRDAIIIAMDENASKHSRDKARAIGKMIGDDIIQDKLLKMLENGQDR